MTKYIPIIKLEGEVQFFIYTAPLPTEGEWRLIRAIIDNYADFICTENGVDTPVKISQIIKTERREPLLRWEFVLRFEETDASRMPSPFDKWITNDELWNEYGKFIGNRDETKAQFEEAFVDSLRKMVGDDFATIEKAIHISGVYPALRILRIKD